MDCIPGVPAKRKSKINAERRGPSSSGISSLMADKLKKGEGEQAAWSDAVLHKLLSELKNK